MHYPLPSHSTCVSPNTRRRRVRRFLLREDGQSLVEFAFVVPILILLVLGIAYFAFAVNDWIDETQLASEGARFAEVDHTCVTKEEFTKETKKETIAVPHTCEPGTEEERTVFLQWLAHQADSKGLVEGATASICQGVSTNSGESKPVTYGEVKLTYNYEWGGLPLSEFLGKSTTITSTAQMPIVDEPETPYGAC